MPSPHRAAAAGRTVRGGKSAERLPLRLRVAGFLLSRAEFVHRELRDFYRTPLGFMLVWSNVVLWTTAIMERIVRC